MTSYVNPSTHIGGVDQIVVPDRAAPSGVDEAPYDDEQYVRVNGEWVPVDTPEIVPDTMAPKPPTALTSSGTMIIGGGAVDYTLSWTPPTQNADGSPLTDFAYYVVRWRYGSSGAYFSFVSNDPATVLHGLKPATNIEWGVLQEIYTPEAKEWHPGVVDRAPAGRLLLSLAWHDVTPEVFQTLEAMAGVRGPSSHARETAEDIHNIIPAPFVDWSRQLPDQFDGTLAGVRSQRWGPVRVHYGAQLGNQVAFAHLGAEARFGPAADNVARLLRFAATPDLASNATGWSAYVGASVRGVGRNELLSKNYDPRGGELDRENAVTRIAGGVAWVASWGTVTFDLAQDSREFSQQRTPQRFGSLTVSVTF